MVRMKWMLRVERIKLLLVPQYPELSHFFNAEDCVSYLSDKFHPQESPSYRIKLTEHVTLEKELFDSKYTKYPTRKGSSAFQTKQ